MIFPEMDNMVGFVILLLLLQVFSPVAGQTTQITVNDSDYFNSFSATRTAYYRWRSWILNHPAVLQKVPPAPKATALSNDDKLNVTVKITPVTVLQVDQARQTVQMASRMEFWWTDPALAVTEDLAESFTDGNVSHMPRAVTIPSDFLWLPPLLVAEGVNSLEVLRQAYRAEVEQDGTIAITLPYVLSFSCRFDISNYPFDEHDCPITVVDPSSSVNVLPSGDPWESALSQTFGVEGEWDLTGVRENVMVFRSDLSFTQCVVHLRRKTTFFVVLTIVPLVVTSYLNVLVFLLPPDLGDKASYLVTVTISMSVFVSFFNTDMPRGIDKMPAIFRLLIFVTIESLLTLGISLFMLRRYKAERCQQDMTVASVKTSAISPELNTTTTNVSYSSGELAVPTRKGDLFYTGKNTSANDSAISKGQLPLSSGTGYSSKKTFTSGSLDVFLFVAAFTVNTLGVGIILASMV